MTKYNEMIDKEDPDIRAEIATMRPDGDIMIIDKGALADGQPTLATRDVYKTDPDFIGICKSFKLNLPGDSYFKIYKRKGDEWVLESEGVDEN